MTSPHGLRLWHPPHLPRHGTGSAIGRQPIVTAGRAVRGYELLYRAPGHHGLPVDRWPARFQDRATEHVIAFDARDGRAVAAPHPSFINFSRSYLLNEPGTMGCDPARVVIEVVESAHADSTLVRRLMALRDLGFRLALDDFVGTESQLTLLGLVDFVKIDVRDLTRQGTRLADLARLHGATLIAERVEDQPMLELCARSGFDLFQGFLFGEVEVIERAGVADEGAA
ncbi:EAL and HDOD domain-containing protein [Demequina lignilytica]|uniref:EAL domain-containing protein n=1 Tax=Demequina lignilytica TaxID=3051663 RepID=A0AB35MF61_9MICO|nr:EAL domain-containing protein [Demequina sp. SYSU T0a273]MDN4482387.1 EAL domain-containing protein [Demequina sp. SYSU T0a273]